MLIILITQVTCICEHMLSSDTLTLMLINISGILRVLHKQFTSPTGLDYFMKSSNHTSINELDEMF